MLKEVLYSLQIINILGRWIIKLIKYYRIILGIVLIINLISLMTNSSKDFPWFTFLLIIYFISLFLQKHKNNVQNVQNSSAQPTIKVESNHYILINDKEDS